MARTRVLYRLEGATRLPPSIRGKNRSADRPFESRRDRHGLKGRFGRELHLAAPAADRKQLLVEQAFTQIHITRRVPDLLERLVREIAELDPDERAEVHLPAERDPCVQKRIQAASVQPRTRRVI